NQRKRPGECGRAWIERMSVWTAARHLLALLGNHRGTAAAISGKCRVGLRRAAVENRERAVDANFKMTAAFSRRIVRIRSGDAHDDLSKIRVLACAVPDVSLNKFKLTLIQW